MPLAAQWPHSQADQGSLYVLASPGFPLSIALGILDLRLLDQPPEQ